MDGRTCTKFKWFWAWQDDKEEGWLDQMSQAGWHLTGIGLPGFYTFVQGEPRRFVYRMDFKPSTDKDYKEYLQLFADAGWEHIGTLSNWQYFRTEAKEGEQPEIFTDNASKIRKYARLVGFLLIFLPIVNIRPKVCHCFSAKVCHEFSARRATQSSSKLLKWPGQ